MNDDRFLDTFVTVLTDHNLLEAENIRGLNPGELLQFNNFSNGMLPSLYANFMSRLGQRSGIEKSGINIFYQYDRLAQANEELHEDLGGLSVPGNHRNAFAFAVLDGCFLFFYLDGDDNPIIYRLSTDEISPVIETSGMRLSEFLVSQLSQAIAPVWNDFSEPAITYGEFLGMMARSD